MEQMKEEEVAGWSGVEEAELDPVPGSSRLESPNDGRNE